jgi:hypothetical protein
MKLTKFFLTRKKDESTMHSVNDDLHDDSDEDREDLILGILVDLVDLEIDEWILIWEICYDDFLDEDFEVDELKYVNEKISKKL